MTISENVFLALLNSAVRTGKTETVPPMTASDWNSVFRLSESHHVLPLIADAAYRSGLPVPEELFRVYRHRAMRMVSIQTARTAAFTALYSYLAEQGLRPLVVKGVVCRELYPNPDFRFSADEDFLIRPDEAGRYHAALTAYGLTAGIPEDEILTSQETGYTSKDGLLYIEVHQSLFSEGFGTAAEFNRFFEAVYDDAVTVTAAGIAVKTMSPTDHLFYLICHALKHFLYGGVGIRQIADICLFSEKYGSEVDWEKLLRETEEIRGTGFLRAVLEIGRKYLGVSPLVPEDLSPGDAETDPDELLADILDSGVYGTSTLSRRHSGAITLGAVEQEKGGAKKHGQVLRTLFPPASSLSNKYTYLKRFPVLLPVAWLQRLVRYAKEQNRKTNSAQEALRIGRERKELLRKYGVTGTSDKAGSFEDRKSKRPAKLVDTGAYITSLMEVVQEGHEVSLPVVGSSMTPFLGDGRDRVFLRKAEGKLKKGDVVLYRRVNGDYVLHRICRVHRREDPERYDMAGDAHTEIEPGIRREQIFAKAVRIERKGKLKTPRSFYWWFFQYIWVRIVPVRRLVLNSYKFIKHFAE